MRLIGNGVRISDCPAAVNPFICSFAEKPLPVNFSDIWVGRCIKNGVKSEYLPLDLYEAESPRCKGWKQFMWNIWILVWNMNGCLVGRLLRVFYSCGFMYVSICMPPGYLFFAFCRGGMESYVYYYISFLDEMALP